METMLALQTLRCGKERKLFYCISEEDKSRLAQRRGGNRDKSRDRDCKDSRLLWINWYLWVSGWNGATVAAGWKSGREHVGAGLHYWSFKEKLDYWGRSKVGRGVNEIGSLQGEALGAQVCCPRCFNHALLFLLPCWLFCFSMLPRYTLAVTSSMNDASHIQFPRVWAPSCPFSRLWATGGWSPAGYQNMDRPCFWDLPLQPQRHLADIISVCPPMAPEFKM